MLSGDSGEKIPEIYAGVVRRHPARIRAIYIRSVNPEKNFGDRKTGNRSREDRLPAAGAAPEAEPAATHAAAEGLIQASSCAVRAEKVWRGASEARGVERRAEVVALPLLAAEAEQALELGRRLHAPRRPPRYRLEASAVTARTMAASAPESIACRNERSIFSLSMGRVLRYARLE